jgi:hypothetical protein
MFTSKCHSAEEAATTTARPHEATTMTTRALAGWFNVPDH